MYRTMTNDPISDPDFWNACTKVNIVLLSVIQVLLSKKHGVLGSAQNLALLIGGN